MRPGGTVGSVAIDFAGRIDRPRLVRSRFVRNGFCVPGKSMTPPPLTALSSCWRSAKHQGPVSLVTEAREFGFEAIELSHGLPQSWIVQLQAMAARGEVRISGVHNFCPAPVEVSIDAPDIYEITDYRPAIRQRAINQTRKTLEYAASVGADYCVFHAGSVPMEKVTERLEELTRAGSLNSREFVRLKHQMILRREALGAQLAPRVHATLEKLAGWAAEFGVPIGVESRSHFEQFPIVSEMRQLMADFQDNPWIGYWHDFGHVQRQANLALLDHGQWLEEMSPYLLGGHLHDVEWPARDHRAPLTGGIDYAALIPHFPRQRWLVWELSPSVNRQELALSRQAWDLRFEELRRADQVGDFPLHRPELPADQRSQAALHAAAERAREERERRRSEVAENAEKPDAATV